VNAGKQAASPLWVVVWKLLRLQIAISIRSFRHARLRQKVGTIALGLVFLVLLSGLVLASSSSKADRVPTPTSASGSAECTAPVPSSGIQGALTVDGGPLPSSAADGVVLPYTNAVSYQVVQLPSGAIVSTGCAGAQGNVTTGTGGAFSFEPSLPALQCTSPDGVGECTVYEGTYLPIGIDLAGTPPAGYAISVAGTSTPIAISLVYELASVSITPGGPTVTTSVGAPTTFTAAAWASNGSATSLSPTFSWAVNGTGWSIVGSSTQRFVTMTAVEGASIAVLTVRADARAEGVGLAPVTATVDAVAVATEIETGATNRTLLDAGGTMQVDLTAVGAPGYPYSASIQPGLGLSEVTAPCSSRAATEGTVEVSCVANLTYPSAGTAQPTANVTNGFSSASWRFPDVTIDPPPDLYVQPSVPVGYAGSPVPLIVSAANGSGTPPYAQACLEPGNSSLACELTPGPAWSFSPVFPGPGSYAARAWAVDADGWNASVGFSIEVVAPLEVGPLQSDPANATAQSQVGLSADVSGGVLPLRYWWNSTDRPGSLLTGELAADGYLNATVVPATPGSLLVTLTVVDRLGTVGTRELLLTIGPAAAQRIVVAIPPPAGAITVGVPITLAWEALDATGGLDRAFDAAVELDVRGTAVAPEAWANASGVGPLSPLSGEGFGVPGSAWVAGALSVNLTLATAEGIMVGLSGSGVPDPVPPMNLTVEPDRLHVKLLSPTVVRPGDRANSTLWRTEDRFGNAVPGALLTVDLAFGGERTDEVVPSVALPGGGSGVWVNYTALTGASGEVSVVDAAGATVLGPLAVPAAPGAAPSGAIVEALAASVPIGAVGAAAFAVVRRRRRTRGSGENTEELQRLAEGRAKATELIGRAGALDLPELERCWGASPPPDLAEWLASLVADGTVRATVGEDGRPRFCLVGAPADGPRVTVDPEVLDRSLRRRSEALDPEGDPGDGSF